MTINTHHTPLLTEGDWEQDPVYISATKQLNAQHGIVELLWDQYRNSDHLSPAEKRALKRALNYARIDGSRVFNVWSWARETAIERQETATAARHRWRKDPLTLAYLQQALDAARRTPA